MSDIWNITLTSSLTIITGVIVIAIGQLSIAIFIKPIQHLKNVLTEIDDTINYNYLVYTKPKNYQVSQVEEACDKLRYYSSQLKSSVRAIPWYPFWQIVAFVRDRAKLYESANEILRLSEIVRSGQIVEETAIARIRSLLGINIS
jgi:hypothetical protein